MPGASSWPLLLHAQPAEHKGPKSVMDPRRRLRLRPGEPLLRGKPLGLAVAGPGGQATFSLTLACFSPAFTRNMQPMAKAMKSIPRGKK